MFRPLSCVLAVALLAATAGSTSTARAQELTDRDADIIRAYDVMQAVTMGLMGATAPLGLIQLYNLPTSFGEGACAQGNPIFGNYACDGSLSMVHGILGIATIASYTATGALALAAPNTVPGEDTITDVLGGIHAVGIGLTGALGLLAANPNILGLHGDAAHSFSRHMRVVHWIVAMVTVGAFATHLLVDQID